MTWQPIETAPKDEMILSHADGMTRLVMWEAGRWVQVGATIERGWYEPTHWKPLPPQPGDVLDARQIDKFSKLAQERNWRSE